MPGMEAHAFSLSVALAGLLGLLAGVALSRANVCMMRAASDLSQGRFEAVGGLLIVSAAGAVVLFATERAGWHGRAPWAWPSALTIFGAVLFALGARLNAACSLGTIGRLASGDIGAVATIFGMLAALALVPRAKIADTPPPWAGSVLPLLVAAMAAVIVLFLALAMRSGRAKHLLAPLLLGALAALLYSLHSQVTWLELATDVFNGTGSWTVAGAGFVCLLAGAFAARHWAGEIQWRRPDARRFGREFLGGALMGVGSVLIPGATDALAFYGVPSGSPHAITAFAVLFGTIVLSFWLFPVSGEEQRTVVGAAGRPSR